MKHSAQHVFEPEAIMAYLDGELPSRQAAELAGHLEHCSECQAVATQLQHVSERLLDFQVEPCPANVDYAALTLAETQSSIASGTEKSPGGRKRHIARLLQRLVPHTPLGWASAFGVLAMVAIAAVVAVNRRPPTSSGEMMYTQLDNISPLVPQPSNAPAESRRHLPFAKTRPFGVVGGVPGGAGGGGGGNGIMAGQLAEPSESVTNEQTETPVVQGPMIVQMASITILASDYDQASRAIQQITAQHGGYVQEMNADTHAGMARSLTAALRIPEKQLEPCLRDLRRLGHVDQEWRNNEEITDKYIDLTARLKNARAEEQRILELLKTRTGKLSDVLEAERELARVRGDIESMDGQRAYMEHEVSYASIQVRLNEQYRAQLNPGAFSTATRLHNSLVEGFGNLGDGILSMLIFVFAYGPSILFWLALIGVPSWFVWNRFRRRKPQVSS